MFCVFVIVGCSKPQNNSNNVISSFNLTIKEINIQNNKAVKNGVLITGKVILPGTIKNNQIKPVSLALLDKLKKEYSSCEWFILWMSDDDRMYESGNYIAMAEYKEGTVNLHGGIPSEKEINEYNKEFTVFSRKLGLPVDCLMIKPTEQGMNIYSEFTKLKQDALKKGTYISDEKIDLLLSKKTNIPVKEIKEVHCGISSYYTFKSHKKL